MTRLTAHEGHKNCCCLFCLTTCPECGADIDSFAFSVSFDVGKSKDMILMQGGLHAIGSDSSDFLDSDSTLECPECGAALKEKHTRKLEAALWATAGGNIRLDRNDDRTIEIQRFFVSRAPMLKEVRKRNQTLEAQ
jgi:hypothetical protein